MPPRTKACAICRKKRIKCDATLPHCLMCIRTGKQCPGPIDGPLIIDMTKSAAAKKASNKAQIISAKHTPARHAPAYNPQRFDMPSFPDGLMLRIPAQIDQGAVINEAFFSNFLAYFTSDGEDADIQNPRTWLHTLPDLSADGTNTALTLALRATATAYCGAESKNPSVTRQAWHLYGQALQAHSRLIRSRPTEFTVHMVSTCVMLSIFEAMQTTTAEAYCEHIIGAVKMMEFTGPGQCIHGVLCQLFFHIRTQLMFVYITCRKQQTIPMEKILVTNLEYNRLPIFQQLMNHMAQLAEMYHKKMAMRSEDQLMDLAQYTQTKEAVGTLWLEYKEQSESRGQLLSWNEGRWTTYRDGFTAVCIAYFSSAWILLSILAARLAATYVDFEDHYATILDCARHSQTKMFGCAYMRMATPLFLVALHSPDPMQRAEAVGVFEDWKSGSMRGISALALGEIYPRQNVGLPERMPQQMGAESRCSSD